MSFKAVDIEIGQIIRTLREKKGLTQTDLALKLGYRTPQFVSLFERGLSKVPLETLGQLSVILNFPANHVKDLILRDYEAEISKRIKVGRKAKPKAV